MTKPRNALGFVIFTRSRQLITILLTSMRPDHPIAERTVRETEDHSHDFRFCLVDSDHGATFTVTRADDPSGPGRSIGASPVVGPNGELYVGWNDYLTNTIAFNRSFDGGKTWDQQRVVAPKAIPFDIAIPAESFRAALIYPVLDTDRSNGRHRGRLY